MTAPLFTGSSLERATACPASQALPHARTQSEAAERGSLIHWFLAESLTVGKSAALEKVPEQWRGVCEALAATDIPELDAASYVAELAVAYNVETGNARELGRQIDRDYGALHPDEVPLSLDTFGLCSDGVSVFVGDWKTGRGYVPPAAQNAQLLLGALATCRLYGRTRADVALGYIHEDGTIWFDRAFVDEWTIDGFASSLRKVAASVRYARDVVAGGFIPDTFAGPHCRYCPAFVHCPAQTALVRTIAESPERFRDDALRFRSELNALTPELAQKAYYTWRRAYDAINRIGEALRAYTTEHGPIELENGQVYGPVMTMRDHVDGAVTRSVLLEKYGQEIAERACTWDSSKSAIREAMRTVAAQNGGSIAGHEREALAAIEAAGGIEPRTHVTYREHARKGGQHER